MMAGVTEESTVAFATRKALITSPGGSIGLNVEEHPDGEFGSRIMAIVADSPAAKAGDNLRIGDVIVKVNDANVLNLEHDDVVDHIVEGAGEGSFTLTVALWEDINDDYIDVSDLDVRVITIDRSKGGRLGAQVADGPDEVGGQVIKVEPDSLAEQSGLKKGDRFFKIDGQNVYTAQYETILDLLSMEKKLEVEVTEQPIDLDLEDQTREVTLDKSHGLGMKIISNHELEGIRISHIVPGAAADATGQIKVGDHIVKINGIGIRDVKHDVAVTIIQEADDVRQNVTFWEPFISHVFLHRPAAVRPALLISAHAHAMPIGACNPMVCPIHVLRSSRSYSRWTTPRCRRCGNFDIILALLTYFGPFLTYKYKSTLFSEYGSRMACDMLY